MSLPLDLAPVLESLLEPVVVCDAAGSVHFANAAAAGTHPVPTDPAAPRQPTDRYGLYHPDGRPVAAEDLPWVQALRSRAQVRDVVFVRRRQDGREVMTRWTAAPLCNGAGDLIGAVAAGRDMPAEREAAAAWEQMACDQETQAEEPRTQNEQSMAGAQQLEAERARLQAVLLQMPSGVAIAEVPTGRLVLGNEQMERIWRHPFLPAASVNEYAGYRGFHRDGRPYAPEEWPLARSVATGETVTDEEVEILRGDGTRGAITISSAPILDGDGKVIACMAVFNDISERRAAEQALLESQQWLKALADTIPDLVFSWRPDGTADYVNHRWEEYTGFTLERLAREGWGLVNHPADEALLENAWFAAEGTGQPFEAEYRYRRHDGVYRWFWGRAAAVKDATGKVVRWVGVLTEIEERRQLERALQAAQAKLEQRVAERTAALLASRAELRDLSRRLVDVQENERRVLARELHDEAGQALTSLSIGLGLLQRRQDCTDELREHLEDLKSQTEEIMQGLHRLAVNLRPVSLDKLGLVPALRQYAETFERETHVRVQFEVAGFNGQRLAPAIETIVYRITQEAMTNAARHARATHVDVSLTWGGGRMVVMVEDDGRGFDVERARLKGRLGLIGMEERAEMVGGRVTVESRPRHGTTVFVEIPLTVDVEWAGND